MKNFRKCFLFMLVSLIFGGCTHEDIVKEDVETITTLNQSYTNVFSNFGKDIIGEDGESQKTSKLNSEYIPYVYENYGKTGVDQFNILIKNLENTITGVEDYPTNAERLENIEITDAKSGIAKLNLFFSGDDKVSKKFTSSSSKLINEKIQSKLESTSLIFAERSLYSNSYDSAEHKATMLAAMDEIIEDIKKNNTIEDNEKSALILSMQLNKENIDHTITLADFDASSTGKGFFKKLFKAIAKVVATVVIVAATVATVVLVAGVVGVFDEPRSVDQDLSGATIGFAGLYAMGNILNGTYKWINKW